VTELSILNNISFLFSPHIPEKRQQKERLRDSGVLLLLLKSRESFLRSSFRDMRFCCKAKEQRSFASVLYIGYLSGKY